MDTRIWFFFDKSAWGNGPWLTEPDKAQWPDPATGLPCMALRNPRYGNWCGYVGVPPEHPLYAKHYDKPDVRVHGGLTFADQCEPAGEPRLVHQTAAAAIYGIQAIVGADLDEDRICHLPAPGEPDALWWFGFDCGHYMDCIPGMEYMECQIMPEHLKPHLHDTSNRDEFGFEHKYRTLQYVATECATLAGQLAHVRGTKKKHPRYKPQPTADEAVATHMAAHLALRNDMPLMTTALRKATAKLAKLREPDA